MLNNSYSTLYRDHVKLQQHFTHVKGFPIEYLASVPLTAKYKSVKRRAPERSESESAHVLSVS